jgi:hypothetical protein
MLTIHPPAFVETEGCDGPKYIRGQPSREEPGVIMTDIQDKYITEFELPYRNIQRYIKEMNNDWNRLNESQKNLARQSFQKMGLSDQIKTDKAKETFAESNSGIIDNQISSFISYLSIDPKNNPKKFMNVLMNTTTLEKNELGITSDQLGDIRNSIYEWCANSAGGGGIIGTFIFLIIIILILVAITSGSGSSATSSNGFGRRLFGRRH